MLFRVGALAACVLLLCSVTRHSPRIPAPGLVLWAWERPEDLRFIDPSTTGVAWLAATGVIERDGSVRFRFRRQPLSTPSGTARIAVVRIESPAAGYVLPPADRLTGGILAAASQRDVSALQIDFDARASERAFYRSLLRAVQSATSLPVGITALASWCEADTWIDSDAVSEAVPMFFRMGRNESKAIPAVAPACRNATGVSIDETWPAYRAGRLYVFNPRAWTEADYRSVLRRRHE
jgi:hypothetical protein